MAAEHPILLVEDIKQRLLGHEYFDDITVLSERDHDILSMIEKGLGTLTAKSGKMGVCCIVQMPTASDEIPNGLGGPLVTDINVLVLENVLINGSTTGTGKDAYSVAKEVRNCLKLYEPVGISCAMTTVNKCIEPVESPFPNHLAYQVKITTFEAIDAVTKVAVPGISPTSGVVPKTVTLSCSTSGASIYYTTDGSHPSPANSNAILYSVPFVVSEACSLRICGVKSGLINSNIPMVTFTAA